MSEYNVKNYTEQGGEKTVIGGTLEIKEGATITGLPATLSPDVPLASIETAGLVKQAENQTDSDASTLADLVADFNALLAKLKNAGVMKTDEPIVETPEDENKDGESLEGN